MSSWEIILQLAVVPLAIMVLLGLLTLKPRLPWVRRERYHPGRPWNHQPVWWTANPETLQQRRSRHHQAGTSGGYGGCRGDW